MKVDPRVTFIFGIFLSISSLLALGTIHLTGLVPADWIPKITGWAGIIVAIGTVVQTAMSGYSGPGVGPLAPPPTPTEVKVIAAQAGIAVPGVKS